MKKVNQDEIRRLVKKAGGNEKVAEALGVEYNTVVRYQNGHLNPSMGVIEKLMDLAKSKCILRRF